MKIQSTGRNDMPQEQQFQENYWGSWDQVEVFRHRAALDLCVQGPVLDIGAGDGFFLALLRDRKGLAVAGLEFSEATVAKAVAKGLDVRRFDAAKTTAPFPPRSFGTVVLLDVLEHFLEPQLPLKMAAELSKSDVVISVPNFSSVAARLQMLLGRTPENNKPRKGHVYWFTWQVLRRLLNEAGLEVAEARFNAVWQSRPLIGPLMVRLADKFPSLFALSFVVRATKRHP
jgi:methionine biosynthesis protein MetW